MIDENLLHCLNNRNVVGGCQEQVYYWFSIGGCQEQVYYRFSIVMTLMI